MAPQEMKQDEWQQGSGTLKELSVPGPCQASIAELFDLDGLKIQLFFGSVVSSLSAKSGSRCCSSSGRFIAVAKTLAKRRASASG